jgi:MFS family permease
MSPPPSSTTWTAGWLPASGAVRRLVAGHLLAVVTEWASVIAVLVYAFEQGGARATGMASLAVNVPQLLGAPLAAALTTSFPPHRVRVAGLAVLAAGYAAATAVATADGSVVAVVAAAVVGLTALSTLRPTGAVLLPALVRTTKDLATGNLWVSYTESCSALGGPLVATALLAIGGPAACLAACSALAALAMLLSAVGSREGPPPLTAEAPWQPGPVLSGALTTMRARPWTIGVLAVITTRSAVIGALDVLLVVLAFEGLGLGAGGVGMLNSLVGLGALTSALAATVIVRRARLAPWLTIGLAVAGAAFLALGVVTTLPVAVAALPVLGLAAALTYSLGCMLLQRSADPRVLGSVFAAIELAAGAGLLVGSALAQVLIRVAGLDTALLALGAVMALVLLTTGRSVWRADAGADVPVVEMAVLRDLPMFSPLPPLELEAVARSARHVPVNADAVIMRQGERGDCFYAVVDGAFAIRADGVHVHTVNRGGCFGEVALLADVARTATVTAVGAGALLEIRRVPFLVAVTGTDSSEAAAWGHIRSMRIETALPPGSLASSDGR